MSEDATTKHKRASSRMLDSIKTLSHVQWKTDEIVQRRAKYLKDLKEKQNCGADWKQKKRAMKTLSQILNFMHQAQPTSIHCKELMEFSKKLDEEVEDDAKRLVELYKRLTTTKLKCTCPTEPTKNSDCVVLLYHTFFRFTISVDLLLQMLVPQYTCGVFDSEPTLRKQLMLLQEACLKVLWRLHEFREKLTSGKTEGLDCVRCPDAEEGKGEPHKKKIFRSAINQLTDTGISRVTLIVLFEILIDNVTIPGERQESTTYRMVKTFRNHHAILSSLMPAITHTTSRNAVDALEYLNVLILRDSNNAVHFLRLKNWLKGFTDILTGGAMVSNAEEVIPDDEMVTSTSRVELRQHDSLSETVLKLSVNIIVYLFSHHFCFYAAGTDQFTYAHKEIPSFASVSMFDFIQESIQILADHAGWNKHTCRLVLVLLCSLLTRINHISRTTFATDVNHHSWESFFQLLQAVENFLFYSPVPKPTKDKQRQTLDPPFQSIGIHVDHEGEAADIECVEKTIELLDGLGLKNMRPESLVSPEDREKLKILKRRVEKEREFYASILQFFSNLDTESAKKKNTINKLSSLLEKRRGGGKSLLSFSRKTKITRTLERAQEAAHSQKVQTGGSPSIMNLEEKLQKAQKRGAIAGERRKARVLKAKIQKKRTDDFIRGKPTPTHRKTVSSTETPPRPKPSPRTDLSQSVHGRSPAKASDVFSGSGGSQKIPPPPPHPGRRSSTSLFGRTESEPSLRMTDQQAEASLTIPLGPSGTPRPSSPTTDRPSSPALRPSSPVGRPSSPAPGERPSSPAPDRAASPPPGDRPSSPAPSDKTSRSKSPRAGKSDRSTTMPSRPSSPPPGRPSSPSPSPSSGRPSSPSLSSGRPSSPSPRPSSPAPDRPSSPPPARPSSPSPAGRPRGSSTVPPPPSSPPPTTSRPSSPSVSGDKKAAPKKSPPPSKQASDYKVLPGSQSTPAKTRSLAPPGAEEDDRPASPAPGEPHTGSNLLEDELFGPGYGPSRLSVAIGAPHSISTPGPEPLPRDEDSEEEDEEAEICFACHILLYSGEEKYEHLGNIYCKSDYLRICCSCSGCGKLIESNTPYISASSGTQAPTSPASPRSGLAAPASSLFPPISPRDRSGTTVSTTSAAVEDDSLMFHIGCFACYTCKKPFSSEGAVSSDISGLDLEGKGAKKSSGKEDEIYQHDRHVYCSEDYFREFGPKCHACGEIVKDDKVTAFNQSWHPDHFLCAGTCGKSLRIFPSFVPVETDDPAYRRYRLEQKRKSRETKAEESSSDEEVGFCKDCYETYLAPKCHACGLPVNDDGLFLGEALDDEVPFHDKCYNCAVPDCKHTQGKDTSERDLQLHNGQLYCEPHFNEKFAAKCPVCGEPLRAGVDSLVRIVETEYHKQCATCSVCNNELPDNQAHIGKNGELLCVTHYTQTLGIHSCVACGKALAADGVKMGDQCFHKSCIKCKVCDKKLRLGTPAPVTEEEKLTEVAMKSPKNCPPDQAGLYCKKDFIRKFIVTCPQCGQPITQGKILNLSGVKYHGDCFSCFTCKTPCAPKKYVRDKTNKIYCIDHIPSVVALATPTATNTTLSGGDTS